MAEIRVVTASDIHYVEPMLVMLASLAKANPAHRFRVTAFLAQNAAGSIPFARKCLSGITGLDIDYCIVDDRSFEDFRVDTYVTLATYYRLFLPDLLPENVDRVLYLDPDVVVVGDVHELWQTPLAGAALAGVDLPYHASSKASLGFAPTELYLNAGVLLIDLALWRARLKRAEVAAFVRANRAKLRFHDQDVLNLLFRDTRRALDPKWNVGTDILRCACRDLFLPEAAEAWSPDYIDWCEKAVVARRILHYSGPSKPWNQYGAYPFHDDYWAVAGTIGLGSPSARWRAWEGLVGEEPLWIYGASHGGSMVRRQVEAVGGRAAGYLDSFKTGVHDAMPVVRAEAWPGRAPVIIASMYWQEILPKLAATGKASRIYLGYPFRRDGIFIADA